MSLWDLTCLLGPLCEHAGSLFKSDVSSGLFLCKGLGIRDIELPGALHAQLLYFATHWDGKFCNLWMGCSIPMHNSVHRPTLVSI